MNLLYQLLPSFRFSKQPPEFQGGKLGGLAGFYRTWKGLWPGWKINFPAARSAGNSLAMALGSYFPEISN